MAAGQHRLTGVDRELEHSHRLPATAWPVDYSQRGPLCPRRAVEPAAVAAATSFARPALSNLQRSHTRFRRDRDTRDVFTRDLDLPRRREREGPGYHHNIAADARMFASMVTEHTPGSRSENALIRLDI